MYIIQIITEFRIYFLRDFGVEGLSSILLEMKSKECFFFAKVDQQHPKKEIVTWFCSLQAFSNFFPFCG